MSDPLWKSNPRIDWVEYYRAVEIAKMRRLMRYDQQAFEEDWELALALSLFLADGKSHFQPMLDNCFQRMLAYLSNNPDARPWKGVN